MKTLPTCCEFHGVECVQGRRCPASTAVNFAAECEGVMPMATGCSLKSAPKPVPPTEPDQPLDGAESAAFWLFVALVSVASAAAVAGFLTQ
jgi:hypothetical protein